MGLVKLNRCVINVAVCNPDQENDDAPQLLKYEVNKQENVCFDSEQSSPL